MIKEMSPFHNFWIHLKVWLFNLRSVFVVYVYLMFIHSVIFSCLLDSLFYFCLMLEIKQKVCVSHWETGI